MWWWKVRTGSARRSPRRASPYGRGSFRSWPVASMPVTSRSTPREPGWWFAMARSSNVSYRLPKTPDSGAHSARAVCFGRGHRRGRGSRHRRPRAERSRHRRRCHRRRRAGVRRCAPRRASNRLRARARCSRPIPRRSASRPSTKTCSASSMLACGSRRESMLVRRLALAGSPTPTRSRAPRPLATCRRRSAARRARARRMFKRRSPARRKPRVEGSVHARAPLGLVNRFVTFPQLKGYLTVDVEGRYGKGAALPALRGKVGGAGIELDAYRLIKDFAADVAIDDDIIRSAQTSVGFGDGTIVAKNLVVEPLKKGAPMHIGSSEATNVRFPSIMRDLDVTPHAHVNWVYKATHVAALDGTLAPLKLDADFTSNDQRLRSLRQGRRRSRAPPHDRRQRREGHGPRRRFGPTRSASETHAPTSATATSRESTSRSASTTTSCFRLAPAPRSISPTSRRSPASSWPARPRWAWR